MTILAQLLFQLAVLWWVGLWGPAFESGMSNLARQIAAVVEEILWMLGALTAVGLGGLAVVVAIVIGALRSSRAEPGVPVPSG